MTKCSLNEEWGNSSNAAWGQVLPDFGQNLGRNRPNQISQRPLDQMSKYQKSRRGRRRPRQIPRQLRKKIFGNPRNRDRDRDRASPIQLIIISKIEIKSHLLFCFFQGVGDLRRIINHFFINLILISHSQRILIESKSLYDWGRGCRMKKVD